MADRTLVELIAAKRDGAALPASDIARLVTALMTGELADYQMAAWLMAVFFRGLDDAETVALTDAMLHSGRVLTLGDTGPRKVDKHSSGGVGDKVSIALAPLVAACGVSVPRNSAGDPLCKIEIDPWLVIPDRSKDIGLDILALFHYRNHPQMDTCKNLAEAVKKLSL